MEMKKKVIHVLGLLAFLTLPIQAADVTATSVRLYRDGDRVIVGFNVSVPGESVRRNSRLVFTPRLCNAEGESALTYFVVTGSRMQRRERQKRLLSGSAPSGEIVLSKGSTLAYTDTLTYEPWMDAAPLSVRLTVEEENCCRVTDAGSIAVAEGCSLESPARPLLAVVMPSPVSLSATDYPFLARIGTTPSEERGVSVRFRMADDEVDPGFADNETALRKIREAIALVRDNKRTSLERITIAGYASPEGGTDYNKQLSGQRADALQRYISDTMDVPSRRFETFARGEDWKGLQALVTGSHLPFREEILDILANTSGDRRKESLKSLAGGAPYRSMLETLYPQLRDACYINVWYSEQEDFAARDINRAIAALHAGNCEEALRLLRPLQEDSRAWNALGSCYWLKGEKDSAVQWYTRAAGQGDEEAIENLKKINR